MATSGSVNFSMTRNEILTDALMMVGAIGAEEVIQNSDLAIANRALNRLIKSWENQALHIWKRSEATVFLQQDQVEYDFGSGSTDHATESYVSTTISSDEASGQTIISVSSVAGISNGDYIGIVLDDDSIHWTTVSSVGASTVTINAAITDDAASGNVVYVYTNKINKPLNILDVRRYEISSGNEIAINQLSYEDYQHLPNKTENGSLVQWTYARKAATGTLYVWQSPSDADYILKMTYSKPLEDFDAAADNPDIPQEWYDALVYQLAVRLAPMYKQLGKGEFLQLKSIADELLRDALDFDDESTYIKLVPQIR